MTELGSTTTGGASTGGFGALASGRTGAVYEAAEVVQAIELGVSNLDPFALEAVYPGAWLSPGNGTLGAVGVLFSRVLPLLYRDEVPTRLTTSAPNLYLTALRNRNGTALSLIAVNTNLTTPARVHLAGSGFPAAGSGEGYRWGPATLGPRAVRWSHHTPSDLLVPPTGLVVLRVHLPHGTHLLPPPPVPHASGNSIPHVGPGPERVVAAQAPPRPIGDGGVLPRARARRVGPI